MKPKLEACQERGERYGTILIPYRIFSFKCKDRRVLLLLISFVRPTCCLLPIAPQLFSWKMLSVASASVASSDSNSPLALPNDRRRRRPPECHCALSPPPIPPPSSVRSLFSMPDRYDTIGNRPPGSLVTLSGGPFCTFFRGTASVCSA